MRLRCARARLAACRVPPGAVRRRGDQALQIGVGPQRAHDLREQRRRLARKAVERDVADPLERQRDDERDRPAPGELVRSSEQRLDRGVGDGAGARSPVRLKIAAHAC